MWFTNDKSNQGAQLDIQASDIIGLCIIPVGLLGEPMDELRVRKKTEEELYKNNVLKY